MRRNNNGGSFPLQTSDLLDDKYTRQCNKIEKWKISVFFDPVRTVQSVEIKLLIKVKTDITFLLMTIEIRSELSETLNKNSLFI